MRFSLIGLLFFTTAAAGVAAAFSAGSVVPMLAVQATFLAGVLAYANYRTFAERDSEQHEWRSTAAVSIGAMIVMVAVVVAASLLEKSG